jgi:Polyketide cyclase / dehydrase and lipid transport
VRELRASAEALLEAGPAECLALLADVGAYPDWCPDTVVRAEDLEDGRARVTLRLGRGPLAGRFDELMTLRVDPDAREVRLERVPHDAADPERLEVTWRIGNGPPTRLELRLTAALELPRLVPLGGMAESVAQGLVAAASRALSPPSPMASASSS